jgi:protein translocase SecG subunit
MLQLIFSLSTLWWMILFLYIPACFGLIIIVLLQKGKGQGLAGAFGMGGGVDTIFGPRSSKSLPQKITYASAAIFMSLALIMSILSGRVGRSAAPDLIEEAPQATMEALFDPNAESADVTSVSVSDEGETAAPEGIAAPITVTPPSPEGVAEEQPVVDVPTEEAVSEAVVDEATAASETAVAEEPVTEVPAEAVEAPVIEEAPAEAPVVEVSDEAPAADEAPAEAPAVEAPVVDEAPAEATEAPAE